jgi:peptidase S41-like protein
MRRKIILMLLFLTACIVSDAQICDCQKEFISLKNFFENNYAGFKDKLDTISKAVYKKKTKKLLRLSKGKYLQDNCILIIRQYLDLFNDRHVGFYMTADPYKIDTAFVNQRKLFELKDEKISALQKSKKEGWEGIYYFTHDSSYKIAVVKDNTPLHDYVGVIVDSKLPTWKKGMLKWEGKLINDTLLYGILYMRNHRPKFEGFDLNKNKISGDWLREGTLKEIRKQQPGKTVPYVSVDSKKLSEKTFYIKISTFQLSNAKSIDSMIKASSDILDTIPNLIIDLRNNGGGSDYSFEPLIKYLNTGPFKTIGVDVLASEGNIKGWKKYLENPDMPDENRVRTKEKIAKMEGQKGQFVNIYDDEIDSSYTPRPFPKKIAILINRGCGSTTEQFLLMARQSSKVILIGENTYGSLDYSNLVEIPLFCFPYKLSYPTTRSRRLDIGQGIDNIGIAPDHYLKKDADWISEAVKVLEQKSIF